MKPTSHKAIKEWFQIYWTELIKVLSNFFNKCVNNIIQSFSVLALLVNYKAKVKAELLHVHLYHTPLIKYC
jgi:hypothetical protein